MGGKVLDLEVRKAWDNGKEIGIEQGLEKGIEQGIEQGIINLAVFGDITIDKAAERLHKNPDEIQKIVNDAVAQMRDESK